MLGVIRRVEFQFPSLLSVFSMTLTILRGIPAIHMITISMRVRDSLETRCRIAHLRASIFAVIRYKGKGPTEPILGM
jgi:hypothetical protein